MSSTFSPRRLNAALGLLLLGALGACGDDKSPTEPATAVDVPDTLASYVYVADAIGFGIRRLALGSRPSWSPDDRRIVYHAPGKTVPSEIRVYDLETSTSTAIAEGYEPSWSPDGKRVVYHSVSGISVVPADGSAAPTLLWNGFGGGKPSFSRDGSRIVFEQSDDFGFSRPFVMNADGSGARPLTSRFDYLDPVYLPDGITVLAWKARHGLVAIDDEGVEYPILDDSGSTSYGVRPAVVGMNGRLLLSRREQNVSNVDLLTRVEEYWSLISDDPYPGCGRLMCFGTNMNRLVTNAWDAVLSPSEKRIAFASRLRAGT